MKKANHHPQKVCVRIDPELRRSVERVFSEIGVSTNDAIRMFFEQVEMRQGLPFDTSIPNAETIAAMEEAGYPTLLERFGCFHKLRDRI